MPGFALKWYHPTRAVRAALGGRWFMASWLNPPSVRRWDGSGTTESMLSAESAQQLARPVVGMCGRVQILLCILAITRFEEFSSSFGVAECNVETQVDRRQWPGVARMAARKLFQTSGHGYVADSATALVGCQATGTKLGVNSQPGTRRCGRMGLGGFDAGESPRTPGLSNYDLSESGVLGGALITRMIMSRWYIASARDGSAVDRWAGRFQEAVLAAHG